VALTTLPGPPSWFQGPLRGRGWEERGGEERRERSALPHFFCYNLMTGHQAKKRKNITYVFIS